MNKQMTLSAISDELASVRTKKKEFPGQIDRIIPWGEYLFPDSFSIDRTK